MDRKKSKPMFNWRDKGLVTGFAGHEEKHETFLVVKGLRKLYNTDEYVDCKFLVGTNQVSFEAHKLILAMASKVFEEQVFTSTQPILLPDVQPRIFEKILRYIYLNESPLESLSEDEDDANQSLIIDLWYTTSRYGFWDLSKEYYNKIKIDLTNWFLVYTASKNLEGCQGGSDVKTFISRCLKVFAVKTPEALENLSYIPERFLKHLFEQEFLNIENELDLFQALVKYANEKGWTPTDQFLLPEVKNGKKVLEVTSLQKYIRDALKQIRYLRMTLKQFDDIPSKSGFFTETEVQSIRNRIADDDLPYALNVSTSINRRYELLHLQFTKDMPKESKGNKDIIKLAFSVQFLPCTLSISEKINFANMTWRIIIYLRKVLFNSEYTIYLQCETTETQDWKCYAQLDMTLEFSEKKQMFENIPWYCFKSNAKYSQMKPIKLDEQVKVCKMELSVSPYHVSYKNKQSNVTATYGQDTHDYD